MKNAIYTVIVLLIVSVLIWVAVTPGGPGKYDTFAQCVKQSGTVFYGAFWCPHCQAQKALFGKSASYLPYVECSMPDGQSITPECKNANIEEFPTWKFAGATTTVVKGEVSLKDIAKNTGCALPQN